ncbi:MAG: hypothetical protein LBK29_00490 [Oscillospiraceae bacterium]|jgi:isopenicillin N synthase-like dioxygenase|nr:hypothetical protein [Oscillospiraceae bacterium]
MTKKLILYNWTTTKGHKKLVMAIKKSKQKKGRIPFPEEKLEGKDFYKDETVFKHLEPVLPNDEKIKTQFKVDLDWFQNEYKKGFSEYYEKASRDNVHVIESFNRYIAKKTYAYKLNIDQIIVQLKTLYLQNER